MTSNDTPASGGRPPRRRTLGRGPATDPGAGGPGAAQPGSGTSVPEDPGPDGTSPGHIGPPGQPGRAATPAPDTAHTPLGGGPGETGEPVTASQGGTLAESGVSPAPTTMPRHPSGVAASDGADRPGGGAQGAPGGSAEAGESLTAPEDGATGRGKPPVRADATATPAVSPGVDVVLGQAQGLPPENSPDAAGPVPVDGTAVTRQGPPAEGGEPGPAGPGPVTSGEAGNSAAPTPGEAPADAGDGGFKVRLANFEGPFDLLLQLIAKHKLDVTEVALSRVTDEFMAYIRALGPDWDLDETTEFLVVAATLLDLKAARLLPAAEVEDEGDLALLEARDLLFARLLQYRAYKRIAEIFDRRLDDEARRHPRTVGLEPQHAELLPEVVISIGAEGFARLAVKAMQPRPEPQVYVDHIHAPLVSVQEQAGIVAARLKELGEASFRALVEDTDDTLTVVARFLALLELYREKAVALDQETALGELTVRWTGGDGDAAPVVTDEFDRPPEQPEEQ